MKTVILGHEEVDGLIDQVKSVNFCLWVLDSFKVRKSEKDGLERTEIGEAEPRVRQKRRDMDELQKVAEVGGAKLNNTIHQPGQYVSALSSQ